MKNFLVPIYIVIFFLSATAFWYFGHHRPAQQILNAEPKHVYISVPIPTTRTIEDSHAHQHSYTHDHNDNLDTPETQTETPLTSEQKTDTTPIDVPSVESQPLMATENTVSPHEHTEEQHSHSQEETERAAARAAARKLEQQEFLENAEITKLQMASEMADFFNTLSIEEQRAHFKMCEEIVYSDIPRLFPGEDTPEDLDRLWNSVLSSLIAIGYTPPEGVNLR